MSAIRLRHVRSVSAFVLLVGCVVFVLPYAQKASAAVLTNGDCSATINEGTGGNANGGIVLTDLGADCLIVFGSARATRTEWIKPVGVTSVRVLVVGAGGYGGYASRGGGGGGGGGEVMHDSAFSVPSASTTVEIFSGRADSTDAVKDASFTVVGGNSLVADGGKNAAISNGGNGSSSTTQAGGGGGNGETSGSPGLGGTSVGGAGGNAAIASNGGGGGGGGGACGAATNAAGANGGNGGAGCSNDITGSAVIYGSGGGGGGGTLGIGGQGGDGAGTGGGDGSTATASERGVASRGGGGGGRNRAGAGTATYGGDGVVIVRYTPVVVDTTPPTLTLATTSSSSNSTSISFTLTGNEAINCATLSSTSGVDFTFTNISSITSIVQTSSNVCTINAESTAVVGTPRTSTLTRSSSFSVADTAGNAQTSVSGSPASVAVTIADSTPPTLTLAVIASTSTSSSIAFTVTGNEAIDCSTLSSSDFTTANIASIDSIVQTNSTTCRINATSTATIGGGMVSSTITASGTFSASDSAGNTQTTLGGGTVSVSVTVPLSDTTAPSASWSAATSSGLSSSITLTFSEAINGLSSADFSNTGTATGCSFTPSATSGTTITVSVLCAGAGTLVARLGANSVQDAAGNQGPTSAASASSTSLSCAQVSSVSVRNTPRRENGVAAASIGSITRAPSIMQVPRNTTNGGWGWVPGATGTSRTIDGVAWNFNSKRSTSLPSGMRVTVEAVGAGVGIQANPQKMSDRGGANGMYMDNTIVGVSGAQLVTADDGCTYGQICVNRGQFKISFTPAATDPILHFSGLGGGGFDSATNGRSTAWTEFQVMNPGVTMTVLGQKNLRLVGSNRIELISKNPTSNCSTTSNGYGATASAGCGSVRFSGTFSEIILQADLGSVNNGNPYVGGRLEDAFILAATVSVSQKLVVVTTTSTTTTVPTSTTTTTTAPATTTTTTTVAPSTTTTTVLPGCPANNNSNNNNSNNNNSNNNNSNNNNSNNNNSNNNTNSGSGSSSGGIVDAYRVDGAKDLSVVTPGGSAKVNPLNGLITPSNGFNTNSLLILDPKSKRWVSSYSDTSGTYTVVDGKVVVQPALGPDEVTMKQFTFKVTDNDGATSVSAHSVLIASLEDLPEDIGSIVAQESTDSFSFKPGTRINIALPDVFDALPGETLVSSSFGFVEPNGKVVKRLNVPQGTWVYKNDRISFMPINGFIGYVRTPVLIKNSEGVVRNSSISLMVSSSAPTLPNTGSQHQQLLIFSLILIFIGVLLHSQMRKRSKSSRFN